MERLYNSKFIILLIVVSSIISGCTKDGDAEIDLVPPSITLEIIGDGFSKVYSGNDDYSQGLLYLKYNTEYSFTLTISDTSGIKNLQTRLNNQALTISSVSTIPVNTFSSEDEINIYDVSIAQSSTTQYISMIMTGTFTTNNTDGDIYDIFGITVTGSDFAPNHTNIIIPCVIFPVNNTFWENDVTFTCGKSKVLDIDGNVYKTVSIGSQCWTSQNLKTTKFNDGNLIPKVVDGTAWSTTSNEAWTHYDNNASNNALNGKLYNWYAASSAKNLCPTGWSIPSEENWDQLTDFLGGRDVAGKKMKSTSGWFEGGNGTNSSGFNGMPSGARQGSPMLYTALGKIAEYWSSSSISYSFGIQYWSDFVIKNIFTPTGGKSCRCVKN